MLRIRPGDNLVLAGLQTSRDERNREGFPTGGTGGTAPMYSSNKLTNSETVILVKPSVVFFSDENSRRVPSHTAEIEKPEAPPVKVRAAVPTPVPVPVVAEDVSLPVRAQPDAG